MTCGLGSGTKTGIGTSSPCAMELRTNQSPARCISSARAADHRWRLWTGCRVCHGRSIWRTRSHSPVFCRSALRPTRRLPVPHLMGRPSRLLRDRHPGTGRTQHLCPGKRGDQPISASWHGQSADTLSPVGARNQPHWTYRRKQSVSSGTGRHPHLECPHEPQVRQPSTIRRS